MHLKHLSLLLIFLPCVFCWCNDSAVLDYYEQLIVNETKKSEEYKFPGNANQFKPKTTRVRNFGTYDFIIVGSGSTGSVVANRLSEVANWTVLLLEAGKFGNEFIDIPAMNFATMASDYNWQYESIPQKYACLGTPAQTCPYPRGRGVGGTTLINALIYARGSPKDFDMIANSGNPGWSYKEILPLFKKSEKLNRNDPKAPINPAYHGYQGYLDVQFHKPRSPQLEAYIQANKEIGTKLNDFNSNIFTGVSPVPINVKDGKRASAEFSFIRPIRDRQNLKILTNSYVLKVDISKTTKTATGVTFTNDGVTYSAKAAKEVILSAGVFGSPQILMQSGIGPKNHLKKVGIPLVQDLEVGSVLRDHPMYFGLVFTTNYTEPIKPLRTYIEEYLRGYGPFSNAFSCQSISYYQTKQETTPDYANIELMLITSNNTNPLFGKVFKWKNDVENATWGKADPTKSFSLFATDLHAKSLGSVRLKNIDSLYEGIQIALKIVNSPAMRKINATLATEPLPACKHLKFLSEEYWYCSLRQLTANVFHPHGSCPMGPNPDKGAVVNSELKVHGINNLRVADASIFPITISGHPNAPCVMVGERVSEFIKFRYN